MIVQNIPTSNRKLILNQNVGWILVLFVLTIDFIAWKSIYGNELHLSILAFFPLLGLMAWTLMWTHYVMSARDIHYSKDLSSKNYWLVTRILVLGLILLHPLLLAWNQWNVSGQLPPFSFYSYVATSLKVYVIFGSLSLLIFLSFELFNHLKKHEWIKKNYKWIEVSQILAMILIFVHAVQLGTTMSQKWYLVFWIILGLTLIPCFWLVTKRAFTK